MADNETKNTNMPDFGEGLRKVFLAGVGALAATAEKGQELVNNLVARGELTVEQGKKLNSELSHKAQESKSDLKAQAQAAADTVRDAAAGLRGQASDAVADMTTPAAAPADDEAEATVTVDGDGEASVK